MSSFISIAIELSQRELLRGQSTSFQIVVRNESGQTLRDVATLDAANRTIGLRLEGNGRPIFADAASATAKPFLNSAKWRPRRWPHGRRWKCKRIC